MRDQVLETALADRPKAGRKGWWFKNRDTVDGYLFLLPFLIVYIVFVIFPVLQAVYMSFFDWDLLAMQNRSFIGLENYVTMLWGREMTWDLQHLWPWRLAIAGLVGAAWLLVADKTFKRITAVWLTVISLIFIVVLGVHPAADAGRWNDALFWSSLGNTIQFVLLSTPLIVGVGLLMALALNGGGRFFGSLRTMFFAPYVFSVSVLTLIFGFLLNPQRGILAEFLGYFGIEPIPWLTDPNLAMPAIVLATLWWTVGFNMVLFLAGLQDIEPQLYEAADLDGANTWQKFLHVTIPGLRRTLLLVVILQIIASFQIFGQVFIMTRGGPGGSTRVLIQHIYESGFRDFDLGYASAMSIFLFLVMFVVSYFQFRIGGEE
ncbi:MAG: sugar ABC transporter permease [Candidatus Promineifilaceae bacterium]|nr:sugar ABC transporter permease [Candidatus Promineifilaceae bacterium]